MYVVLALLLLGVMLLFALSPNPFVYLTDKLGIGRTGMPELALSGGTIGQVLAENAAGTGVDIIATKNVPVHA